MSELQKMLQQLRPPACFFACEQIENENNQKMQAVQFIIKEKNVYLQKIPSEITIGLRTGTLAMQKLAVVVLLARLGNNIYECYFNFHSELGKRAFALLEQQQSLYFLLFNEKCQKKRTLVTNNTLQDFFAKSNQELQRLPKWTPFEFQQAKDKICNACDLVTFWKELG